MKILKHIIIAVSICVPIFYFCCYNQMRHAEKEKKYNDRLYSFFVAGHVYGNPSFRRKHKGANGIYPLFFERIKQDIKEYHIDFGVFTGDIVYRNTNEEWDAVEEDINELNRPIYMAPGNHDTARNNLFSIRYSVKGKTYQSFYYHNDIFIILDPNIDGWNISGEQLKFLKNILSSSQHHKNIFVFFHQILWWEKDNKYRRSYMNSKSGRAENINFWEKIYPLFTSIPNNVYMFAGDSGAARHSLPTYSQEKNIHLISSGMGGGVNDNYVLVTIPIDTAKSTEIEFIWLNSRNGLKNYSPY
ncbi:MAG: hypothetical protein D3917_18385 [Candidatus Electrothrix sp. AX5]|nr:hypothetical protein [Candidatus Electrothrix sp. AX5]